MIEARTRLSEALKDRAAREIGRRGSGRVSLGDWNTLLGDGWSPGVGDNDGGECHLHL